MLCKDITQVIEAAYPIEAALDFDNVGLLAGRSDKEVNVVYVALDATEAVIREAVAAGADMLITHHPLVFSPVKKITDEDFVSRRIVKMIREDLSYYAMHTNYDVMRMADIAGDILGIRSSEVLEATMEENGRKKGIGCIGQLEKTMMLDECAHYVKNRLKLEHVKVFGDAGKKVKKIAVCPGSGKSVIGKAIEKDADVLVTGDIGHHEGIDAVERGLSVIDAGHYGTEYIFIMDMKRFLECRIPELKVIAAPVKHPFHII